MKCELCGAAISNAQDAAESLCQECYDGVRWTIVEERWAVAETGVGEQTAAQIGDLS